MAGVGERGVGHASIHWGLNLDSLDTRQKVFEMSGPND